MQLNTISRRNEQIEGLTTFSQAGGYKPRLN